MVDDTRNDVNHNLIKKNQKISHQLIAMLGMLAEEDVMDVTI